MIGQTAMSRRRMLVQGAATTLSFTIAAGCASATSTDVVLLPDFRLRDDPDDTAALARAFATGRPVRAPAGGGSGIGGRYLVGNDVDANLPNGATLIGDGINKTIFARPPKSSKGLILHCDSKSPDPSRNITGLRFNDLCFEDDVARLGFAEFSYLVMLNGVTDVRFERVAFRGFRGDGLHLGSSAVSQVERHNRQVWVQDCIFDGVNANNRNAISVIDCDELTIERSVFINCTRPGDGTTGAGDPMNPRTGLAQPGAIDIEPNGDRFAIVRNIVIRGNRFTGGGGFAVSLLLPANNRLATPISGITIENNRVASRHGGFQAFGYAGDEALTATRGYGITMRNNVVRACKKPFLINGVRGIGIHHNSFVDCSDHAELGYQAANAHVVVENNRFERIGGTTSPYGLWVRAGTDVVIGSNEFIDCGTPGKRNGIGVGFVQGVVRRLSFKGNRFTAPTGRMTQPLLVFREAKVEPSTLSLAGNRVDFAAKPIDALITAGH